MKVYALNSKGKFDIHYPFDHGWSHSLNLGSEQSPSEHMKLSNSEPPEIKRKEQLLKVQTSHMTLRFVPPTFSLDSEGESKQFQR